MSCIYFILKTLLRSIGYIDFTNLNVGLIWEMFDYFSLTSWTITSP